MRNYKRALGLAFALLSGISLFAQQTTLSPYTRYGYGNLYESSFGPSSAMGGVTYGIRSNSLINPGNPASYSTTDSTTFLFDVGVFAQTGSFYQANENGVGGTREQKTSGNFEYAAMQFPIIKNMGASIGIMPFSSVGYRFGTIQDIAGGVENIYEGSGGLSEVYAGLAYNFFNRVSLGVNASYLFGTITHSGGSYFTNSQVNNSYVTNNFNIKALKTNVGLQYSQPIGKNMLTIGAVYTPGISPKSEIHKYETTIGSNSGGAIIDTIALDPNMNKFTIPQSFGVGASYKFKDKWLVAADYTYQDWQDAKYYGETDQLNRRQKIAGGVEYLPSNDSRAFFKKLKYRFGGYYSDSYLKTNTGSGLEEFGLSAGVGIPIKSSYMMANKSMINLSFEYINKRPTIGSLIKEDYFRVTLNMTFNEFWFFKRKLD
ncbi:MAG: hypothetical protein ACRC9Q_07390 [Bacteroidales bacterium]